MQKQKPFPRFWEAVLVVATLIFLQLMLAIAAYDLGFRYEWGDPVASGIISLISGGMVISTFTTKIGVRSCNATFSFL